MFILSDSIRKKKEPTGTCSLFGATQPAEDRMDMIILCSPGPRELMRPQGMESKSTMEITESMSDHNSLVRAGTPRG